MLFKLTPQSLKFAGHRSSLANLFACIAGVATELRIKRMFKKEMLSTLNHVLLSHLFVSANRVKENKLKTGYISMCKANVVRTEKYWKTSSIHQFLLVTLKYRHLSRESNVVPIPYHKK